MSCDLQYYNEMHLGKYLISGFCLQFNDSVHLTQFRCFTHSIFVSPQCVYVKEKRKKRKSRRWWWWRRRRRSILNILVRWPLNICTFIDMKICSIPSFDHPCPFSLKANLWWMCVVAWENPSHSLNFSRKDKLPIKSAIFRAVYKVENV